MPEPSGAPAPSSGHWTTRPAAASALAAHLSGVGSDRPRVTFVHGFAQTGRCLGPLADELARHHEVVSVDAPGHGGSRRHADADLWRGADLLVGDSGPQVLVGYSMGGRLALHAALSHPDQVLALVLIASTAGIDDRHERRRRRERDHQLAQQLEVSGLEAFLRDWLAMPMFAGLPHWARFDEERRRNTVDGLAASLRHAGTGSMTPLWDRLAEITCPVLVITGADDPVYTEVGARLERGVGGPGQRVVVPRAGHAVHLEAPEAVTRELLALLESVDPGQPPSSRPSESIDP